jgi:DNA-binding LacI/PurR family transcriptional regulator
MLNLTSVDQRLSEMTQKTVALLLKQIRTPDAPPEQHFIVPELIARRSSRRAGLTS